MPSSSICSKTKTKRLGKGCSLRNLPIGVTVDLVAKILRRGRSFTSSKVSPADMVDLTANARRLGGEERSSFGAIG